MNQSPPEEEILLYSADTDPELEESGSASVITGELVQRHKWKMQNRFFRILDGKTLEVLEHFLTSTRKYQVRLVHLDPEPVKQWRISVRSGLAALFFGTLAGLPLSSSIRSALNQWTSYTMSISALLIAISLIFFSLMVYRSKNMLVFVSYHGRYPMVNLLKNSPSKQEFTAFCRQLSGNIRQSREASLLTKEQQLAAEVGELRKMKENASLSDADYETVKARIFAQHRNS